LNKGPAGWACLGAFDNHWTFDWHFSKRVLSEYCLRLEARRVERSTPLEGGNIKAFTRNRWWDDTRLCRVLPRTVAQHVHRLCKMVDGARVGEEVFGFCGHIDTPFSSILVTHFDQRVPARDGDRLAHSDTRCLPTRTVSSLGYLPRYTWVRSPCSRAYVKVL